MPNLYLPRGENPNSRGATCATIVDILWAAREFQPRVRKRIPHATHNFLIARIIRDIIARALFHGCAEAAIVRALNSSLQIPLFTRRVNSQISQTRAVNSLRERLPFNPETFTPHGPRLG